MIAGCKSREILERGVRYQTAECTARFRAFRSALLARARLDQRQESEFLNSVVQDEGLYQGKLKIRLPAGISAFLRQKWTSVARNHLIRLD